MKSRRVASVRDSSSGSAAVVPTNGYGSPDKSKSDSSSSDS